MKDGSKQPKNEELKHYAKKFIRSKHLAEPSISYRSFLQDKFLVTHAVREGVTNMLFKEIKTNSPFDDQQWSEFLDINVRTLQRYKKAKGHVFKTLQSEKILALAEVISIGNEVFDSPEEFNLWLNTPSTALGNEKPVDLLDNSYGKDLVLTELLNIEHGVFV